MPNVEHSTLSGSELHEPKGITSASINEVYAANGASSGAWKTIYTCGVEDYNHSGPAQTLNTSYVDLQNNGLGANTNKTYQLPGYNDIWDTTNHEFDWVAAGLVLGDLVQIRFDFGVTTAGASSEIMLALDLAHGSPSEYRLPVEVNTFKSAGSHAFTCFTSVYMGNTVTLDNPCKVVMKSDNASDTVTVNGWAVFVYPRKPVFD